MAGHDVNDQRQRTDDVEFDRSILFSKMFLSEPVVHGLTRNKFIHPSPIQARAIPLGKLGLDLLVQAKSGTGKTLVFAVLIAETHNPDITFPQSLTIVPTREIAVQIENVMNKIGYSIPNFRARSFIGGLDVSQDRKNLQNCSAVVGTPGRINHLIKSNVLNTRQIKILVLDEADSLIAGTMKPEVDQIIKSLPLKRQTLVCSATYYNNRDRELLKYLNEKFIGVTPKKEVPVLHGIRQFVQEVPEVKDNIKEMMAKIGELNQILKKVPYSQCLVFANTQTKAETYCSYLNRAGWPAEVIRGGQEQRVRLKTVENLKEFRCRVLTATDVISRGIDAENVNLVINVDVPRDNSIYLHRIGRAGRFGTQAIAITLLSSPKEVERFRKILYDIGGNDMFVYKLPKEAVEEIWNFDEYGEKYERFHASALEQEIRDQGADRSFLETIQEVDSKTELERKSDENLNDSLEEPSKEADSALEADSIEEIDAQEHDGSNEPEETVEKITSLEFNSAEKLESQAPFNTKENSVDDLFLAAMNKVDAEEVIDLVPTTSADMLATNMIPQIASAEELLANCIDGLDDDEETRQMKEMLKKCKENEEDPETPQEVNKSADCNEEEPQLISKDKLQFGDDELQKVMSLSNNGEAASKVDQMFLSAMAQLDLDDDQPKRDEPAPDEQEFSDKMHSKIDQMFLAAISKYESEEAPAEIEVATESNDSINIPVDEADQKPMTEQATKIDTVDQMFLEAMNKLDFQDSVEETSNQEGELPVKTEQALSKVASETNTPSSELSCSTPESCYTDSSFSSNATKKVEVGSNFTTPTSRVQDIRGAAPTHQVSSSTSDNSSVVSQISDAGVPTDQNCLPLEVNNDALFAKIMKQKELDADQQQRPFQFSIDGCSLEVHDDPVSDRDINSRKGSVPDVVPCGISMDPSRLHNRPSSVEEEAAGFDLNSNTCGSNHGSVFENEEEAVVPQDQRPKRIRFQQEDDKSSSVGVTAGTCQQCEQPDPDPLALPPISDVDAATEEAEDASSYSSEYDSESSNSSFFDQRGWESETTKRGEEAAQQRHSHAGAEFKPKVSKRAKNATNLYHRTYANWTVQYWNQMTMIRDYARFATYARHSAYGN